MDATSTRPALFRSFLLPTLMNEQKRVFTGIWIPRDIVEDDRLDWIDRALYGEIQSFDDCFKSNEALGERLGETERNVQKRIAKLKEYGYLVQTGFDGRTRHLQTCLPVRGRHVPRDTPATSSGTPIDNSIDNILSSENKFSQKNESSMEEDILIEVDEEYLPVRGLRRTATAPSEPLMDWATRKTGRKFASPLKQRKCILTLKAAGYDEEDIKATWLDLEIDPYWSQKGIDFGVVLSQIDKMQNRVDLKKLKKLFDERMKEMNLMVSEGKPRDEIKKFVDDFVRPLRDKYGFR